MRAGVKILKIFFFYVFLCTSGKMEPSVDSMLWKLLRLHGLALNIGEKYGFHPQTNKSQRDPY